MISLQDLIKVRESLAELDANVEDFNWGPSIYFARKRKEEALRIIEQEINHLRQTTTRTRK